MALVIAASVRGEDIAAELEDLAARFPFFCSQNFFRDQPGCWGDRGSEYRELVTELSSLRPEISELVPLLNHEDPKVRTLAIAVLFATEDPRALPYLAAKAEDIAPTFATVLPDARPYMIEAEPRPPILESRTVGQIAEGAVRLYLEPAGFFGGVGGSAGYGGFEEYWAGRKQRTFCAGWFLVQLARASQSTSPTPPNRRERIRGVRRRIDRLPRLDRAWTLLWLNGEEGSDVLVTEDELLEAAAELGPERLSAMLERKIASKDPDLQPRNNNNYRYARMGRYVLERAGRLLREPDAERLLACERRERQSGFSDPMITAWWAIGAAQVRPDRVGQILVEAMPRFQPDYQGRERADLAAAIWRWGGPSHTQFLIDWFYTELPLRGWFPHSRAQFLNTVSEHAGPSLPRLLAGIISDDRFDSLDWQSLRVLAKTVNGIAGEPVVTNSDLEKARHPLGEGHFHWERERAAEKYPDETHALLKVLEGWRASLRSSLARWSR